MHELCRALKAFSVSEDGIREIRLTPGDKWAIRSTLVDGLVKEGYVERVEKVALKIETRPIEDKAMKAAPENKDQELVEVDVTGMSDADLRSAIKDKTGKAPGPRSSRETLVRMYGEAVA